MNYRKPIGGYFELELFDGLEYYSSLIRLNTGRNALEYILIAKNYKKIYLPYYSCDVLLEPIKKLNLKIEYYKIDGNLQPIDFNYDFDPSSCFLYINYFGLKDNYIRTIQNGISNLIVDNSQAFFSKPIGLIDTFYSCRKFFGVPDGAYLQCAKKLSIKFKQDKSYHRFTALLERVDLGAEEGYDDFIEKEETLSHNEIFGMSKLTLKLLKSINYKECTKKRMDNFNYLHNKFKCINEFKIDYVESVPMIYPLLIHTNSIRQELINNKIFVATYWPYVKNIVSKDDFEFYLTDNLIPLPIDQRYNISDMKKISETILMLLNV